MQVTEVARPWVDGDFLGAVGFVTDRTEDQDGTPLIELLVANDREQEIPIWFKPGSVTMEPWVGEVPAVRPGTHSPFKALFGED